MKILELDLKDKYMDKYSKYEIHSTSMTSSKTVLGYDIIIWNPNNFIKNFKYKNYEDGNPILSSQDFIKSKEALERRKEEFNYFLSKKGLLVVFLQKPIKYYSIVDRRLESNDVNILPVKIITKKAEGENIEFRGNNIFNQFWLENKNNLYYEAYIEESYLEPFLFIRGTDKPVGAYKKYDNNSLLILPSYIENELHYGGRTNMIEEYGKYINTIVDYYKHIVDCENKPEIPDWANDYTVKEERKVKSEINIIKRKLEELDINKDKKIKEKEEVEKFKILFTGTGRSLVEQVKIALEYIGFEIVNEDVGRDDIVMRYKSNYIVVEVKGVSKSAAEKNAAQLEKWVSEYKINHNIQPKGILIVNGYKNIPLKERNKKVFPDQMIPYSRDRKQCLLSGLQLFNLYYDCVKDESKSAEIVEKILNTDGVFEYDNEWEKYIEVNHVVEVGISKRILIEKDG